MSFAEVLQDDEYRTMRVVIPGDAAEVPVVMADARDAHMAGQPRTAEVEMFSDLSIGEIQGRLDMLLQYLSVCTSHMLTFLTSTDSEHVHVASPEKGAKFLAAELDQANALDADIKVLLRVLRARLKAERGTYDPELLAGPLRKYTTYGSALQEVRGLVERRALFADSDLDAAFPPTPTAHLYSSTFEDDAGAGPGAADPEVQQSRLSAFFSYFYPRSSASSPSAAQVAASAEDDHESVPLLPVAPVASSSAVLATSEPRDDVITLSDGSELVSIPYTDRHMAEEAAARRQSLEEIEAQMAELHAIFLDVSAMVEVDGEGLEAITDSLENTTVQIEEGNRMLSLASKLKNYGLPLVGAGFGGLLFGPVGALAGAKGASAVAITGAGAGLGWASVKSVLKMGHH